MTPDDSSCPDGSEYVWHRGVGVFKAELKAAEVDPRLEIFRDANVVSKK